MRTIVVAVGSKRRPKLNAVWEALTVFGPLLDSDAKFDVEGLEVPSGVVPTPLSRAETMSGARQRAEALVQVAQERGAEWRFFVGLEGGLDVVHEGGRRMTFLENWAYVTDGTRGAYGHSGGILLPEALAARVLDDGIELAEAIDAFAGGEGIRNAQGAWGVLTRNMISRQDAFRTAVINAFAPFYNAGLYERK